MKKLLLFLVIPICLFNCETKKSLEVQTKKENQIVIGQIDTIYSDILKENRKIWVHVPKNVKNNQSKYPVLYLLDGDSHFHSVTGMIKQLSTDGNTISPEMVVVGITNTDRTRDLTPTHINEMYGDTIFPKTSGGGKRFLSFIDKELMPYIEKEYPVTSYKTFVGHSLGGLTVIDALIERPNLFNNYVAIDPSLWWDNQKLLKRASKILSSKIYEGKTLYLGVANTMDKGMTINKVENDTTENTEHIRSILKFAKATESIKNNGLLFDWKYYENDDHGSVPLIAEYDAIRFLFPWYKIKYQEMMPLLDSNSNTLIEDLLNWINTHYKNVSSHFGYEVLPDKSLINNIGYRFIN